MDAGSLCRKGRYRPFVRRGDRGRSTESFVQTPRQDGRWLRNDRLGFPQDRPLVALRFGQLEWENPLSHENRQRKLSELGSVGREPTTCRTRRGAGCNFARVSWHPVRVARCEWTPAPKVLGRRAPKNERGYAQVLGGTKGKSGDEETRLGHSLCHEGPFGGFVGRRTRSLSAVSRWIAPHR